MGCGVWEKQIKEVDKALSQFSIRGLLPSNPAFQTLTRVRTDLLKTVGVKLPRIVSLIIRIVGFSPGVIALWHDNESGFMAEARETPSSPPIYKLVSGETAVKILRHDISPELELFLMTPDEDQDN